MARYIDADRLLSFIQYDLEIISPYEHTADDIVMMIQTAPSADVEPVVHAKWKRYNKRGIAVCTNCSLERKLDHDFGKAISCPNCRAKMDQEL